MIYPRSRGWEKGKNKIFHAISGPEGRVVEHGYERSFQSLQYMLFRPLIYTASQIINLFATKMQKGVFVLVLGDEGWCRLFGHSEFQ